MLRFRESRPTRSAPTRYASYRRYKDILRKDFFKKCGYCDDADLKSGGWRAYQIDHFVPKNVLQLISENDYNNLVYSCPFCNNAKKGKWPTQDEKVHNDGKAGFIDPCHPDYDMQFERVRDGEIRYKTPLGKYMYEELKLYLKRHAIIWNLERLDKLIEEVKNHLSNLNDSKLKEQLNELLSEHHKYLLALEGENDR